MIVFVSGMQRSGSTFSFNIVRELLERRGTVYQEPAHSVLPVIERSNGSSHVIQKAHATDIVTTRLVQLGAIKSVCTVRKPEEAIASWMTVFKFSLGDSILHMQQWLHMYDQIRAHSLVVPYEQIIRKPAHAAWQIADYLCPGVSVREVSEIVRKFSRGRAKAMADALCREGSGVKDIGFSYYDERTFLHRGHVAGVPGQTAVDRIGLDAVAAIRQALHGWLDDKGDLVQS